ncbi:MAG: preprotein translocase subunit SecG [Erysipelotrichaceae bacterium]|nr:preprotein translocase subunit SecG [Erysipelotrichaceae bacterium]
MTNFLNVLLMIVAGLIIILVLLQSGKSDGLSAAFTGSGDLNLFAVQKERGPEKFISRSTLILGIVFFALVILIQIV